MHSPSEARSQVSSWDAVDWSLWCPHHCARWPLVTSLLGRLQQRPACSVSSAPLGETWSLVTACSSPTFQLSCLTASTRGCHIPGDPRRLGTHLASSLLLGEWLTWGRHIQSRHPRGEKGGLGLPPTPPARTPAPLSLSTGGNFLSPTRRFRGDSASDSASAPKTLLLVTHVAASFPLRNRESSNVRRLFVFAFACPGLPGCIFVP